METKHTKGQWKTTEVHNGYYSIGTGAVEYINTKGQLKQGYRPIAFVGGNYCSVDEAQANAKLMASAPKLLEVLSTVKSTLTEWEKSNEGKYRNLIMYMDSAITNATTV